MTKFKRGINFSEAERFPAGYETLSDREQKYYKIMNSQSGVLFITSEPGIAKSAMMRSIAKKLGLQYFDVRLSMVDETDVGLFPTLSEKDLGGGKKYKYLQHVVPEWAYIANEKPTIIHFEELNRASLAVRNAALQILLEREIGAFFKFNENVLMVSSGNLGEEDGTDVEEFDQALNNRLIHVTHLLPYPEWVEQFASEHVCPTIVGFLKTNTEHYYKKADERTKTNRAYATPRSWTFLSDYIFTNFGKWEQKTDVNGRDMFDPNTNEPILVKKWPSVRAWLPDIQEIGISYVGPSAARFIRYCQDTLKITLDDILEKYDELEADVKAFNRDKKSELITNMKERRIAVLKPKHVENLVKFLMNISDDEIVGYLLHVLDTEYNLSEESKENKMGEKFLSDKRFAKFRDAIMKHVDDDEK